MIWHGADKRGARDVDSYCDAWHSNSQQKFGFASSLLHGKLLDQEKVQCSDQLIVLCIEATSQEDYQMTRDKRQIEMNEDNVNFDHLPE